MHASDKHPVVKTNIYPVPDLKYPFPGAHFTVDVYGIIVLKISVLKKYLKILMCYSGLFLNNDFGFRNMAIQELRKSSCKELIKLAGLTVAWELRKSQRLGYMLMVVIVAFSTLGFTMETTF